MSKSQHPMDPTIAVNLSIEFEGAWRADKKTEFQPFLEKVSEDHRLECFRILMKIEAEKRQRVGQLVDPVDVKELGSKYYEAAQAIAKRVANAVTSENLQPTTVRQENANARFEQIGPYKLLQLIGSGGMGEVWMAEQVQPVRRRVALKIIKPGKSDNQLIARFDAERQALAMMDHQNIARVYDAGKAEDGSPYLVMELVQGISITEYCDRSKMTLRERLQLFLPVCKAIQHAHQKGIIHRDLKPANVLVCIQDGEPVPKVIDFGLAKAMQHQIRLTDKTMFTEFGQVLGTIQYMSPEQAVLDAVDIDTRSDIYSLGACFTNYCPGQLRSINTR